MRIIEPTSAPKSEWCKFFLQGMVFRMAMSFHRYGLVAKNFPWRKNALRALEDRLRQYRKTGNKEYLIDVANMAMIEFMHPRHPKAHFRALKSEEVTPIGKE